MSTILETITSQDRLIIHRKIADSMGPLSAPEWTVGGAEIEGAAFKDLLWWGTLPRAMSDHLGADVPEYPRNASVLIIATPYVTPNGWEILTAEWFPKFSQIDDGGWLRGKIVIVNRGEGRDVRR